MGEQEYLQGPVRPGSSGNEIEPADPPITGPIIDVTEKKTIPIGISGDQYVEEVARAPVTVTVDDKIVDGPQRAETLAMLGVAEEVLDDAWRSYVTEVNGPIPVHYSLDWGGPQLHQEGMGWRVDVEVVQDPASHFVALADIDPRSAKRMVTFTARKWYYTDADREAVGAFEAPRPPTGKTEISKQEPLEASGAVSASWRKFNEDEMDSTANTAEALLTARMEIGWARKEIQVALKVANAAWQGPRSDATKFKFGLEYEMLGDTWAATDEWRKYIEALIKLQRDAKEQSDNLRNELIVEGVFMAATGLGGMVLKATFGAARAAKTALVGGKVVTYAQKIARLAAPLRAQYGVVIRRLTQSSRALFVTRALARGTGGLATTAAVNEAGGRSTTTGDWLMAYGMAWAGLNVSEKLGKRLKSIEKTHDVNLPAPAIDASKSVVDGGTQTQLKALLNEDALGTSFALGLGADAVRRPVELRYKKFMADELRKDPKSVPVQRAEARLRDEGALGDAAKRDQYINEEIEKTVNRRVDPVLDFTYSLGTQAAEKAHETVTRPAPSADDLPPAPAGTVAQPVAR